MSFPSARTRRPSERIEQPAWPSLVDAPKTSVLAAASLLVRRGAREDHHDPASSHASLSKSRHSAQSQPCVSSAITLNQHANPAGTASSIANRRARPADDIDLAYRTLRTQYPSRARIIDVPGAGLSMNVLHLDKQSKPVIASKDLLEARSDIAALDEQSM